MRRVFADFRRKQVSGADIVQPQSSFDREGLVRIGPVMAIPEVLRDLGADPAAVLGEIGLDPGLFGSPDNLIGYATRARLIAHCVARTGCQHFGLLLGQHASLTSFGLVGLLARSSPDVGTALRNFVHYFHLHVSGASADLRVEDAVAILSYHINQRRTPATDQVGDGAVAIMVNMMRELCDPGWEPLEARFAHQRPQDIWPFRSHFRAPLRFDAEEYALAFSAQTLECPLPEAGPELYGLLRREIDALETRHGEDFPAQVRSVLRTAILTGHASEDEIARIFSIHGRTLSRRLRQCGSGFRQLMEESRFELAQQMLRDTTLAVSKIAEVLGYTSASTFTRSFRRWSGNTPTGWRQSVRQRDAPDEGG